MVTVSNQIHIKKLSKHKLFLDAGGSYFGLVITSFMNILQHWQYLMRCTIDAENLMTSTERIVEYGSLQPEADLHGLDGPVDTLAGNICFKNVWLRYAEDEVYVLKNLSFNIQEKEKV